MRVLVSLRCRSDAESHVLVSFRNTRDEHTEPHVLVPFQSNNKDLTYPRTRIQAIWQDMSGTLSLDMHLRKGPKAGRPPPPYHGRARQILNASGSKPGKGGRPWDLAQAGAGKGNRTRNRWFANTICVSWRVLAILGPKSSIRFILSVFSNFRCNFKKPNLFS